ncbi:MAG TPA: DUF92 domain-containing protein [Terriglobales bacterium]|nr:DUF92 domain-containing protein [Terriglobales bacterium]
MMVMRALAAIAVLSSHALTRPAVAAVVTAVFALVGRVLRGVNTSGALTGAVISFAIWVSAGPKAFVAVAVVFVVTLLATKAGYSRKLNLGTAERKEGRSVLQVAANLAVAAGSALAWRATKRPEFIAAIAASLAEAAADTSSAEIGQAGAHTARLITTFHAVPAGTDGGVTLIGTAAGILAGLLVTSTCALLELIPIHWILPTTFSAVIGMLLDSVLGATLERRHYLDNNAVNFLGTLAAAALAAVLVRMLA